MHPLAHAVANRPMGSSDSSRDASDRPTTCAQSIAASFQAAPDGSQYRYSATLRNKGNRALTVTINLSGFPATVPPHRVVQVPASGAGARLLGEGTDSTLNASTVLMAYDGSGGGRSVVRIASCAPN